MRLPVRITTRRVHLTKLFPMLLSLTFLALLYAGYSLPRVIDSMETPRRQQFGEGKEEAKGMAGNGRWSQQNQQQREGRRKVATAERRKSVHNAGQSMSISKTEEEEFVYGWHVFDGATGELKTGRGRKGFDPRLGHFLRQFQLGDGAHIPPEDYQFQAKMPGITDGAIFVTAASQHEYPALRALVASIKRRYGKWQRVVVYDLGGISEHTDLVDELNGVCTLELRRFNFTQFPDHVRDLKSNAWKIVVLAHAFAAHHTFIYCDPSVQILNGEYDWHFRMLKRQKLSPFLFTMSTFHGIRRATFPGTLEFLPLFLNAGQRDVEMQESNFIIVQKSEFSRRILKWALLCALTRECIDPAAPSGKSVIKECPITGEAIFSRNTGFGFCHGFERSLLSILVHNAEAEEVSNGNEELILHQGYNHPSHRFVVFPFFNHRITKNQTTEEEIGRIYKCHEH